jgi:hypothetical protein
VIAIYATLEGRRLPTAKLAIAVVPAKADPYAVSLVVSDAV